MDNLDTIGDDVRRQLEAMDAVRETTYKRSRDVVRLSARTIRALHRAEWDSADAQLAELREAARRMSADAAPHPEIYFAGYTQDALKEYVEANLVVALMHGRTLPTPGELGVEASTWLNGLAEAATELRRRILDIIRHGHSDEAETLLDAMQEVYTLLVTIDFPDSITRGLRRRTDTVRAVLERTRGDVTHSLRQAQLEAALARFEQSLHGR